MGKVIDLQKWKEKKEEEMVLKKIDDLFIVTTCPIDTQISGSLLNYFDCGPTLGPSPDLEFTSE